MLYIGIQSEAGKVIREEEALGYALERSLFGSEEDRKAFQDMLVEWFYSGDWQRREESEKRG